MRFKKRRGVFYTPARLAELLAAWSIRSNGEVVLEPSFGGCGFIEAIKKRFVELGSTSPLENIFGCDVDPIAFKRHLPKAVGKVLDQRHFRKTDFLSLEADAFPTLFDAVIGNPPYVSYHNMFKRQRVMAAAISSDSEFRLSGMASLWAYFVFHSLKFVKEGGRMGWLLPGSVLHADYGKKLLRELSRRFDRVAVISLHERVFSNERVSETTEVLICDGYRGTNSQGEVEVVSASSVDDCARFLEGWRTADWKGIGLNCRAVSALTGLEALSGFERIGARSDVVRLTEVARIAIGIVTGANRVFIINEATARDHRIPDHALKPIFAKFGAASGIRLLSRDLSTARRRGASLLLVDGAKVKESQAVRSYFDAVPKKFREKNITFAKHADWRCPDDAHIPDAFFPYMHHLGPRLVLNECGVNTTNTIHRVYFNSNISSTRRKWIAISLLSTFSQLSAEIEGRSYGAGVLKHEPGEAGQIRVLIPDSLTDEAVKNLFKHTDVLLRTGRGTEATKLVDDAIFSSMSLPRSHVDWKSLGGTLKQVRARRHKMPI
jgi:adenine-specific DNA-methyltransferase